MWRRCRPLAPVEPAPAPAEHLARNKRLRGANRYPGAACPAARTPARTSYPAPTASLLRAAPSRRRSAGPAAALRLRRTMKRYGHMNSCGNPAARVPGWRWTSVRASTIDKRRSLSTWTNVAMEARARACKCRRRDHCHPAGRAGCPMKALSEPSESPRSRSRESLDIRVTRYPSHPISKSPDV